MVAIATRLCLHSAVDNFMLPRLRFVRYRHEQDSFAVTRRVQEGEKYVLPNVHWNVGEFDSPSRQWIVMLYSFPAIAFGDDALVTAELLA